MEFLKRSCFFLISDNTVVYLKRIDIDQLGRLYLSIFVYSTVWVSTKFRTISLSLTFNEYTSTSLHIVFHRLICVKVNDDGGC